MGLTTEHIFVAIRRVAESIQVLESELNAADATLGDGDTGMMLRRVVDRLSTTPIDASADVGATFRSLAMACAGSTGSSLGTLITLALLSLAKATTGQTDVAWRDLGRLLHGANAAMMERGGARLGDKTVVDAVDAVATAIAGLDDPAEIRRSTLAAAQTTLAEFRDRPCRMGRARMFGAKSVGLNDPGMLAFVRILETLCVEAMLPGQ